MTADSNLKTALVTGAGSGVGRAIALALLQQDWIVVLVGRTPGTLQETQRTAANPANASIFPCDIGDADAVRAMAASVLRQHPAIEVVVNAAGVNVPDRSLERLSLNDYRRVMNTNLHGPFYVTQAFLPAMRQRRSGTIINIVSDAGLAASPKAGPCYVMSKFGMAGLTQAINAEERGRGIRATSIFPGDINTPLLDKRPSPPPAAAREQMLQPQDIAACALLAIHLPPRAIVEELLVRPR